VSTAASTGIRAPAGYRTDWALFTDWCAATGAPALPAAVGTVEAFLAGCPAAPATVARRVAAIGWHHRHYPTGPPVAGIPDRRALRASLGRPPPTPTRPPPDPDALAAAVRALPTTGGGLELRAEATESVTGSSGWGVIAPPPDLEVARRWTRSRPEPARPGARPAHPRDRRRAARVRPDTLSHRGRGHAPQRTGPAPQLRPPPAG
jgi:hypothetical protein